MTGQGSDGARETLLRLVRHNTWANLKLLEFCATLPAEALEWTTPGTFGTLHHTLRHIVGAEHGYLRRLTGELPPIEVQGRGKPLARDSQPPPLPELVERATSNGERLERFINAGFDPLKRIGEGAGAATAIVVAQYVHHGSDHRAHAGTILGAHGKEPALDANEDGWDLWGYATAVGEAG